MLLSFRPLSGNREYQLVKMEGFGYSLTGFRPLSGNREYQLRILTISRKRTLLKVFPSPLGEQGISTHMNLEFHMMLQIVSVPSRGTGNINMRGVDD